MSAARFEDRLEGHLISDAPALLNFDAIRAELSRSYWADARQRHTQELAG